MMKKTFSIKRPDRRKPERFSTFAAKALCAAFAGAAVCGCGWVFDPLYVLVDNVAVNHKTLTLTAGETATITADFGSVTDPEKYILLDDASWESGNTAVATVEAVDNATCKITAVAVGTAVVTVKVRENGKTDQCTVTVKAPDVEKVTISQQTLTLETGESATLTATVSPEGVESTEVVWSSDKPEIAAVDAATGEVTGVAVGTAVITATSRIGGKSGQCVVTVAPENILDAITDPAFKAYALDCMVNENKGWAEDGSDTKNYPAWDSDGDGKLSLSEAAAVECVHLRKGYKDEKVQSLAGIEYFRGLKVLRCDYNTLEKLDLSQNTALTYLSCDFNQLTELDVTQNTALTILSCSFNQLKELDVTQNTALTYLNCGDNQLTELDVTQNTALTYLICDNNQLTALDASNMASPDSYTLICGEQRDGKGGGRELTLTLRAEQKALWESFLSDVPFNNYVKLSE